MPAEKCGSMILVKRGDVSSEEKEETPTQTHNRKTQEMLDKIRTRFPNFFPMSDGEVWLRARSLGLMDEE